MISALAMGARVFNDKTYEKAAIDAADFIINNFDYKRWSASASLQRWPISNTSKPG